MAFNAANRFYEPGKATPFKLREEIILALNQGARVFEVCNRFKVSRSHVYKLAKQFQEHGDVHEKVRPGQPPQCLRDSVLNVVETWKLVKPSLQTREVRQKLLSYEICEEGNLPALSTINDGLRLKLGFTHKKLKSIPSEYYTDANLLKVDEYFATVSRINPVHLHFFDESSVIKTTGNRKYGSSYRGRPAVEIQRYASNASLTINLLHGIDGPQYYNIIPGASNGEELVNFFTDVVHAELPNGLPVIIPGDVVVMDNCGFHHGFPTELLVRNVLEDAGASLVFQPPYSPHLNTCEFCFHEVKAFLRKHETAALDETELMVLAAVESISATHSYNYFRHCGYV